MEKFRTSRLGLLLLLADVLLVPFGLFLATILRSNVALGMGGALGFENAQVPWPVYILAVISWVGALMMNGVYDPRRVLRWYTECAKVTFASVIATFFMGGALYFSYRETSRLQIIYFLVINIALLLGVRLMLRFYYELIGRSRPGTQIKVLVLGAGKLGQKVGEVIFAHARWGFHLVGYLDDDPLKKDKAFEGAMVLGGIDDVNGIIKEHGVEEVWIALPVRADKRLNEIIMKLEAQPVRIYIAPDYLSLALVQARADIVGGIPIIGLREPVIMGFDRFFKRAFDLVISLAVIILLLPFILLIMILIWIDSPGPIIFRQQRVGENGRLFNMIKFRTMVKNAEALQPVVNIENAGGEVIHKRKADPRVTRIGRFLRHYSLDELPQLFNVIKGDMSLVGPRPEMPWLVDRYKSWQRKRFSVPQGITGWWQINGRSDKPMHLNTDDDLYYVYNYSLWLDIRILLRTPLAVIGGRGAF